MNIIQVFGQPPVEAADLAVAVDVYVERELRFDQIPATAVAVSQKRRPLKF